MKKAFLDLDGTLVDSKKRHVEVLRDVLSEYGLRCSRMDDYIEKKTQGFSTKWYLENCLKLDIDLSDKINKKWIAIIEEERYLQLDSWYDDSLGFLLFLKKSGYENIIVSARNNEAYARRYIQKSIQNQYIDDVFFVPSINAIDNKVKVIRDNIEENSIIIGDTEMDYESATIVGIDYFILNRGFRSKLYWENKSIVSYDNLTMIKSKMLN